MDNLHLKGQHPKADHHYASRYDEASYLERTKRNWFWFNGPEGQKKLRKMRIGVAGLGGMGSNIAEALVRMGIGQLRIADPDHIERTNLNRQVIANKNTIGVSKAAASAAELRAIAEDFELVVYKQGITEETVEEFVEGCDAIVDEIDVFPLDRHVLLHRAASKKNIPLYSAYAVGLGIHFYKFQGEYTFEHLLGSTSWQNPSAEYLLEIFGTPLPEYLSLGAQHRYKEAIASGGTPIFGPATLLGHSLVTTRLILDLLGPNENLDISTKTPVMPEFLILDPLSLSFRKFRAPTRK